MFYQVSNLMVLLVVNYIQRAIGYFTMLLKGSKTKTTIRIVTNDGVYKRFINTEDLETHEINIDITNRPNVWDIVDITVLNSAGIEQSYYKTLRPYFGPKSNIWINNVADFNGIVDTDIQYLTIILEHSETKMIKTYEFSRDSIVIIPNFELNLSI